MRVYRLIFWLLIWGLSGCSSVSKTSSLQSSECLVGASCTLSGRLTIHVGFKSSVGLMNYADTCVSLALPNFVIQNVRKWDEKLVRINAKIYANNQDGSILSYKLDDRWVTAGVCKPGIVLYVNEIETIK